MNESEKVGLITFGVFMTEAMIHYNIGVNKDRVHKQFEFPPASDLFKIALVVGAFSILNGVLVKKLA